MEIIRFKQAGKFLLMFYTAYACFSVYSKKILHGDGVRFFQDLLLSQSVSNYNIERVFAEALVQTPLLLTIDLGIYDLEVLSAVYGASLFLPVVLGLLAALYIVRDKPEWMIFPLSSFFLATMNTDFMMVAENRVFISFMWPTIFSMIFLKGWRSIFGVAFFGFFLLRSYPSMIFFGPVLSLISFSKSRDSQKDFWEKVFWSLMCVWFFCGVLFSLHAIINPKTPENFKSFIESILFFVSIKEDGSVAFHLTGLFSVLISLVLFVAYFKEDFLDIKPLRLCVVLIGLFVSVSPLIYPRLFETELHYKARIWHTFFPLFLFFLCLWMHYQKVSFKNKFLKQAYTVVLFAGFVQIAWNMSATYKWKSFLDTSRQHIANYQGFVEYEDSFLVDFYQRHPSQKLFDWGWTWPMMSIFLSENGDVGAIIGEVKTDKPSPNEIHRYNTLSLPPLKQYGIKYDRYIESLAKQEANRALKETEGINES